METSEKLKFSDKIINSLRNAAKELEELRVQAALGTAEAREAFEEAKKSYNKFAHEAKLNLDSLKDLAQDKSIALKTLFETIQVKLALGKAETKEMFEEQRKNIMHLLAELETFVHQNKTTDEFYSKAKMETEKFKIKLEMLKLRYELKKIQSKEEFEMKKMDFSKTLEELKNKLRSKEEQAEGKWEDFKSEIENAYSSLRKAFS